MLTAAVPAAPQLLLLPLLLLSVAACSWAASSEGHSCHKHFVYSAATAAENPECNIPPARWGSLHTWCRDVAANRPSPIQLRLADCSRGQGLRPLLFSGSWLRARQFSVRNNGHSVQATALGSDLTVTGGSLRHNFTVVQLHFHWGSVANMQQGVGSEHQLFDSSGQRVPTPAELHIVCRRADLQFSEAAATQDAVAVIGVFLQQGQPNHKAQSSLLKIIASPRVRTPSSPGRNITLRLRSLLPASTAHFVNYDGAFTTPNCNPTVQWHIFTQPLKVKRQLLRQFTKNFFDAERKQPMQNNFRPVMGLHGRRPRCR